MLSSRHSKENEVTLSSSDLEIVRKVKKHFKSFRLSTGDVVELALLSYYSDFRDEIEKPKPLLNVKRAGRAARSLA